MERKLNLLPSKDYLRTNINNFTCLTNNPYVGASPPLKPNHVETYTLDDQCRFDFGEDYKVCDNVSVFALGITETIQLRFIFLKFSHYHIICPGPFEVINAILEHK